MPTPLSWDQGWSSPEFPSSFLSLSNLSSHHKPTPTPKQSFSDLVLLPLSCQFSSHLLGLRWPFLCCSHGQDQFYAQSWRLPMMPDCKDAQMFARTQYTVIPAQPSLIFLQIKIMMTCTNIYYVPGAILRAWAFINLLNLFIEKLKMRFKVSKCWTELSQLISCWGVYDWLQISSWDNLF